MPFKIIRNDITKVKADAIVNTANPAPVFEDGTEREIYMAAGAEELLAQRKAIGAIRPGEAEVTDAFALNAKYIIHTVGPSWVDGKRGEFDILKGCYENSLKKALELDCKSIAFPLISTGVYGFPKAEALQTAVSVFSSFLLENEMQIILVVFDKKAFELSGKTAGETDSFIDSNYVKKQRSTEYLKAPYPDDGVDGMPVRCRSRRMSLPDEDEYMMQAPSMIGEAPLSLDDELKHLGPSFHDKLFELIDESGIENKDVWKLANLDRKHFSKIQCDAKYHPKKKTVMALCIALKLDLEQSKDLLARADWAFSPSSKTDLIVQKAIMDKQYDIIQLNTVLFKYTSETLGA